MFTLFAQAVLTYIAFQAKGTAQASLVSKNMQDTSMTEAEEDCLKWAASSLFSGKTHFVSFVFRFSSQA